ncbi:MAG: dienelactone hydrolase family protein [Desulfosalsimonas sp.]
MRVRIIASFILAFMFFPQAGFSDVVTETVTYEQNGKKFEGYLARDDGIDGKRPGVLVVHEWWGLNEFARRQAEKLAKMGYNAFALDMYGKDRVTEHPEKASEWSSQVTGNVDLWRRRAGLGLDILRNDSYTDKSRIAAVGYCFGGSTVQQLAYAGADIRGVVSFHGSLLEPPEGIKGEDTPEILICHGASDPMTEKKSIPGYISAMEESGIDWQLIIYGGARHSFTNPDADDNDMDATAYDESADKRSWMHMKIFLDELF